MRRKMVAGNWKMHGSQEMVQELLSAIVAGAADGADVDMVVFPPFPFLGQVQQLAAASPVAWGAQTLSEHEGGAYTGEVSGAMIKSFGCRYVLVGHSERRALYGESDQDVARKFVAAQRAGLKPVLCVGECLEERESGDTERVVARQLDAVLEEAGVNALADAVVAYEPVWAIGTGKTATPDQAQEVHAFIRDKVAALDGKIAAAVQILYGGSVKPGNAAELMSQNDIDGGLIGGASLTEEDFLGIYRAVL